MLAFADVTNCLREMFWPLFCMTYVHALKAQKHGKPSHGIGCVR